MVRARAAQTTLVGLATAAVALTALSAPAHAEPRAPEGKRPTQAALDELVRAGNPGAVARATDGHVVWSGTSGVGSLRTGKPRSVDDRYRIGSITKTFVATVLLQLESEGRLSLDDTVHRWLPDVIRGNGNDGRKITVRQLLNHTSGLHNYTNDPAFVTERLVGTGFLKNRYRALHPRELIEVALAHQPDFEPGARFSYSNTGYIVAGLIIEKITGRTYEREVRERIIKPLGLNATVLPGSAVGLPKPSSRAYSKLSVDLDATRNYDATEQNASWAWSAGDMISTTGDLNRFISALLRGKLLSKKQLSAMKTTVPDPQDPSAEAGYGLGIASYKTRCGTTVWGHTGGIHGSRSETVTSADGRHTLSYNLNGEVPLHGDVVDAEFCGTPSTPLTSDGTTPGDTTSTSAKTWKPLQ